ncbi:MAG: 1-deoxy-D-xylulose-5-phosphate synthase, partial [Deltaproteobacteria bacterium]|nr:1-deoxy-D-xylulose-5-phosphate synthase [Deltaproteobacteria bacterium]
LRGDKSRVIAVIGDASLTGGMAFEALNQAGDLDKDIIVILNDNEMSISPNVGAISSYLSRKATGRTYFYFKRRFQLALKSLKGLPSAENIFLLARRLEDAFKSFFTPGMLFEAFKFDYIGPIDGHRLDQIIETLENVRQIRGPILVHVLTTKGKGYKPAEDNPVHYHGVTALNGAQEPAPAGRPARTYTQVFGRTMCRLAHREERLVAITAAMPEGTGLHEFTHKFPDRTFDVGIAEQHAVALAAGLAVEGFIPVVAIYSTFMQRAYDQIIHDVCLPGLHVVLALDRGGIVGEDGPTHQGLFDLSYLRTGPKMVVIAPRDENILQHALNTAVGLDGPVALRYPRGRGSGVDLEPKLRTLPLGRGECLREGKDILLLPAGHMVAPALEAAEELAKIGLKAAVVDPVFIKPLDSQMILDWAQTCGRVVTIEENVLAGGFGSGVGEMLAAAGLTIPLKMIGIPDKFVEHGSQQVLRSVYGLDSAGITATVKSWINGVVPRFRQAKAG